MCVVRRFPPTFFPRCLSARQLQSAFKLLFMAKRWKTQHIIMTCCCGFLNKPRPRKLKGIIAEAEASVFFLSLFEVLPRSASLCHALLLDTLPGLSSNHADGMEMQPAISLPISGPDLNL